MTMVPLFRILWMPSILQSTGDPRNRHGGILRPAVRGLLRPRSGDRTGSRSWGRGPGHIHDAATGGALAAGVTNRGAGPAGAGSSGGLAGAWNHWSLATTLGVSGSPS